MSPPRLAFTFVEVLACLLVIGLGVAAAIGMTLYGARAAAAAQGRATGMSTALTIAYDPTPLLPATNNWTGVAGSGEASGNLNGFYVIRHEQETHDPGMVLPQSFHSCVVTVDVFDSLHGNPVASYTTRVLRQDPQ